MPPTPRELDLEAIRAQARALGLDLDDADVADIALRAQRSAADVEAFAELIEDRHEPAITFGRPRPEASHS